MCEVLRVRAGGGEAREGEERGQEGEKSQSDPWAGMTRTDPLKLCSPKGAIKCFLA